MLAEPKLHKCKKNAIVIEIGRVEHLCFSLPLSTKLGCYFLDEGCEFIELLLWIITVKEIKVWVVVDLAFFWPKEVLGGLWTKT